MRPTRKCGPTIPIALDLRRDEGKHVAFGGSHYCLGASLRSLASLPVAWD